MSERISEEISGRMLQDMSDKILEDMSARTSQDMLDKMPKRILKDD